MKLYGLKHNGVPLKFDCQGNGDVEDCNDVSFALRTHGDHPWLVDSRPKAERAKRSTEWYNAGYETPEHEFGPNDLEIYEMKMN